MTSVMDRLDNNAMFYKDITQWLRNRTFPTLFFGLLLIAEIITLLVLTSFNEIAQPAVYLYYSLFAVLMAYGFIVGQMTKHYTRLEFRSGTFDLFQLSGLTEQQMVNGKLLTMFYEFAFGFFCLVPFMFFSYYLGGLDFMEMMTGILLSWFVIVPLYLVNLIGALTGRRGTASPVGVVVAWAIKFAMFFFLVIPLTVYWRDLVRALSDGILHAFSGSLGAFITLAIIAMFYFFTLTIMHTVCYEQISGPIRIEDEEWQA